MYWRKEALNTDNNLPAWLLPTAISTICAITASWFVIGSHVDALTQNIPPPIAVVSYPELTEKFFAGMPQGEMEKAYELLNGDIEKLHKAGYIVLDGRFVLGAPKSSYVPIPDVNQSDKDFPPQAERSAE